MNSKPPFYRKSYESTCSIGDIGPEKTLASATAQSKQILAHRTWGTKKRTSMKIATMIARVLLGLLFVVFGLNIFFPVHPDAAAAGTGRRFL